MLTNTQRLILLPTYTDVYSSQTLSNLFSLYPITPLTDDGLLEKKDDQIKNCKRRNLQVFSV